jgi:hypothetical protein
MTYATQEVSEQDGAPVLLYWFQQGATAWYYYAGPGPYLYGGNWYQSESINNQGISSTGEINKNPITITLPITNPMAAGMLLYAADQVTSVTVFRTHVGASTGLMQFKGRVLSSPASVATVTLNCENAFASMRRQGLTKVYQRTCNLQLYGAGCNVPKAGYGYSATVTNVTGNVVTVAAVPAAPASYVGGTILAADGTLGQIIGQSSSKLVLTLSRQVTSLNQSFLANPGGFTATLYRGCDKSTDTCRDVFHNLGNFRGWKGINGVNPMSPSTNGY